MNCELAAEPASSDLLFLGVKRPLLITLSVRSYVHMFHCQLAGRQSLLGALVLVQNCPAHIIHLQFIFIELEKILIVLEKRQLKKRPQHKYYELRKCHGNQLSRSRMHHTHSSCFLFGFFQNVGERGLFVVGIDSRGRGTNVRLGFVRLTRLGG